jgi:hypothetical protein
MTGDLSGGDHQNSLSDIKVGIGTTTVPGPDGSQNAEVHVFPEAMVPARARGLMISVPTHHDQRHCGGPVVGNDAHPDDKKGRREESGISRRRRS